MIKFNNTYSKLPESFFERSIPSAGVSPELLAFNHKLAQDLGIETQGLSDERLARVFSGMELLEGSEPMALAYAGHQFGYYNPSLGDGRAHLLGEVVNHQGERFDIQLKGSGQSKFSRRGDGRSWIGPVIREYILSEAMHALGIPTTRALAAVTSGEQVYREEVLPGGIFTRVGASHLRVGTFEYIAARSSLEDLRILVNYAIERHEPDLLHEEKKYILFLKRVAKRKLSLVAKWMGIGFIHGVMNTDNTSIAGITIDYGPCAFMDKFSRDKVFSSIDRHGRYAYSNQGRIAIWNLSVLANALFPLLGAEVEQLQEDFIELEQFYEREYLKVMGAKLGIFDPRDEDKKLIDRFLYHLEDQELDFTNSFRNLNTFHCDDPQFLSLWESRLLEQGRDKDEVLGLMNASNPFFIPRNHQVEKAIVSSLEGDNSHFLYLTQAYENPYEEREEFISLTLPPEEHEIVQRTFCGT